MRSLKAKGRPLTLIVVIVIVICKYVLVRCGL